jgi:DNA-binding GntR family transcriptional regulator
MLAAEGLVAITPRRGAWARAISLDELRDVFEMRSLFELFALARARRRTASEQARMRALLSEAQALLEQGNIEAWYEASQAFHDAIIDSAENRQLKALYKLLKLSMRRYQLMVIGLPRHPDRSQTEHQQIFDAFARGDSDRACTVLRAHLDRVAGTLAATLKEGRIKVDQEGQKRSSGRRVAPRASPRPRTSR